MIPLVKTNADGKRSTRGGGCKHLAGANGKGEAEEDFVWRERMCGVCRFPRFSHSFSSLPSFHLFLSVSPRASLLSAYLSFSTHISLFSLSLSTFSCIHFIISGFSFFLFFLLPSSSPYSFHLKEGTEKSNEPFEARVIRARTCDGPEGSRSR